MNSKTLGQVLGAVGGAVLLTSPILLLFGAAGSSFVLWQAIVGILLVAAYIALDPSQVMRMLTGRGTFFAATAGGVGLAVLATMVIANYLAAAKFPKTWDLSQNQIYTLSPDTQKTVKDLKSEVLVTAFITQTDRQFAMTKDLLERYHQLNPDKFKFEFVDPDQSPEKVKAFNIKKESGAQVVVEAGKQQDKVQQIGEEGLTNAIVKVTHAAARKVYFVQGHGEADPADTEARGYSTIAKALADEGITAAPLPLLQTKEIPKDAAAVIVAGPEHRFLPPEVETLKAYLAEGGRMIVLLDPQISSGLEDLLKDYGVLASDDEIIDPLSRLAGTNLDTPVIGQYGQHEITKGFNLATVFPTTRSLIALNEAGGAGRPLALATTNPTAWGETDFAMLAQGKTSAEGKKKGALAVALVVSKPVPATEKDKRSDETRLVVFGDSEFPNNRWGQVGPGNQDLFMNTVSWLAEQSDRITIRPKAREASHLTMNQQQMTLIQFFSIDVLPVTLLAVGIAVWRVRRAK
jgi:ABC-type uncharacterized transport system involved in gliding motility auxiliary subunit